MRKTTIFMLFAVMVLGINAIANDKILKNENPAVSGDMLVADNCDPPNLWSQEPEDCDGNWALVTSDTDYGCAVYDDYSVNEDIGGMTLWFADLYYSGGWEECAENPMPVVIEFTEGTEGRPDTTHTICTYNFDIWPVWLCQVSGSYDIYRADFTFHVGCDLHDGWVSAQGIGNEDSCAFLWYNSTTGNGVNSYQTNTGVTDYEQAFCLYEYIPPYILVCDINIVTPLVPSINGDVLFDLRVTHLGNSTISPLIGEIYPTIGDCSGGTIYDFNLTKVILETMNVGEEHTGYYFYHIADVSAIGLNDVALNVDIGDEEGYYESCCDEFRFYNPWGRTGGEVAWGDNWYERGGDAIIPGATTLGTNYPNPFNARTSIPFELSRAGNVSVKIYNLSGQLVETVIDGYYDAGAHSVNWDASSYSSGIYFYALDVGDYAVTKKMNYVK